MDDAELIRRTLAGRREDFEVLVERYQKVVYGFVLRQLQDPDAADEIVQATFVKAYTRLATFRSAASFKTWLHQIALNECRTRRRSRYTRREVSLEELPESAVPSAHPAPWAGALRTGLVRLIGRLPQRQRSVLTLRVFSDLPFREIGRVEGISENSAKVNYHHAVKRLKEWISQEES